MSIFATTQPPGPMYDICGSLRQYAKGSYSTSMSMAGSSVLLDAANEIERLRKRIRDLEETKSPEGQREIGYANAQRDIRRALGIDD